MATSRYYKILKPGEPRKKKKKVVVKKKPIVRKKKKPALPPMSKAIKKEPRKTAHHVLKKEPAPVVSAEQLHEDRKKQNALNKSRSRAMETRIAKTLHGRRVPMSGAAAAYKGDVEIPLQNYPGVYMVECKFTEARTIADNIPVILLFYNWLTKMHTEAKYMNSKFAVLVVSFLGNNRDYVFVRSDIVDLLINRYHTPYAEDLVRLWNTDAVVDVRKPGEKQAKSLRLRRDTMDAAMVKEGSIEGMKLITPVGDYMVVYIDIWARITEHM